VVVCTVDARRGPAPSCGPSTTPAYCSRSTRSPWRDSLTTVDTSTSSTPKPSVELSSWTVRVGPDHHVSMIHDSGSSEVWDGAIIIAGTLDPTTAAQTRQAVGDPTGDRVVLGLAGDGRFAGSLVSVDASAESSSGATSWATMQPSRCGTWARTDECSPLPICRHSCSASTGQSRRRGNSGPTSGGSSPLTASSSWRRSTTSACRYATRGVVHARRPNTGGPDISGSVHLLDLDDDTVSAAFDGVDRQRKPRSSCLRAVSTLTAAATTSECNGSARPSWICTT